MNKNSYIIISLLVLALIVVSVEAIHFRNLQNLQSVTSSSANSSDNQPSILKVVTSLPVTPPQAMPTTSTPTPTTTASATAPIRTPTGYIGATPNIGSAPNQPNPKYKEFNQLGFMEAQIPFSWSVAYHNENYLQPDSTGEYALAAPNAIASIGEYLISYSDIAWTQIDIYASTDDITNSLIAQQKKYDTTGAWSKATIEGVTADVVTESLDNGQVDEGGTGGKTYYFTLSGRNPQGIQTLVIVKQAQADADFENGFKNFLNTLQWGFTSPDGTFQSYQ